MTSAGVCPFRVCDIVTPGNHLLPTELPAAPLPGFKRELLSMFSLAKSQGSTLMVLTRPWIPLWALPHAQGIMMPGSYFHLSNQVKLPPPNHMGWSHGWKWKCQTLSGVWLFATPWTVARQTPLSMGFSRQEYWGCHSLLQGIFPTQGLNLGLPHCRRILYHLSHRDLTGRLTNVVCMGLWGWKVPWKAPFVTELENPAERVHQIQQILITLPRVVIVVMRYLFAFLNQWVAWTRAPLWLSPGLLGEGGVLGLLQNIEPSWTWVQPPKERKYRGRFTFPWWLMGAPLS